MQKSTQIIPPTEGDITAALAKLDISGGVDE